MNLQAALCFLVALNEARDQSTTYNGRAWDLRGQAI